MKVIVHLKSGVKLDTFIHVLDSAGSQAACEYLKDELTGEARPYSVAQDTLTLGDLVLVREQIAALEAIY